MKRRSLFFIFLLTGCATTLKTKSVSDLKQNQSSAIAAFVLTDETLKRELQTIYFVSPSQKYEVKLDGVAALNLRGAKVFMVELPEGVYRLDRISYGGRFYNMFPEAAVRSQFHVKPGKITALPTLNVIKGQWRDAENDSVATALVTLEAKDAIKKAFPERTLFRMQELQTPRQPNLAPWTVR